MTRRERVIAALEFKETDIVPYYMDFTTLERQRLEKSYGKNFDRDWQYHLHIYAYCGRPVSQKENPECFIDDFGTVWDRSGVDKDIGVIKNHVIPDIEENAYVFPKIDEVILRREMEYFVASAQDKFTVCGIGFSVFERAWTLCGMENILMAMISSPDALTKLLDDICEFDMRIMDIMLDYPFDAFYFGDDWGSQRGLIMGLPSWQKFIKPIVKKLYAKAKASGRFVIQHSCGLIEESFSDLVEIGLNCYQTFQSEVYDIEKVKKNFGGKLAFWGGISTQQLLAKSTAAEVKKEAARIRDIMKLGGGYIMAPTHTVPHDVPAENILALYEVMTGKE